MKNKVFVCKFNGHWPVGASAVIVAAGVDHAKHLLEAELKVRGLPQDIPLNEFTEINTKVSDAHIITDGEY